MNYWWQKVKESYAEDYLFRYTVSSLMLVLAMLVIDSVPRGVTFMLVVKACIVFIVLFLAGLINIKWKWKLSIQYFIFVGLFFIGFFVQESFAQATVDWTSYLIYFVTSLVLAGIYLLVAYVVKKEYRKQN